jgi:predicted ester cyclase
MDNSTGTRLVHRLNEIINAGDVDRLGEVFPEDYMQHNQAGSGLQAAKDFVRTIRGAFPDGVLTLEDVIEAGDKVVARTRWRATHQGELFGVPATGRPVDFGVIDIYRVQDGQLVEHWDEADTLGLMQQLGAIPTP